MRSLRKQSLPLLVSIFILHIMVCIAQAEGGHALWYGFVAGGGASEFHLGFVELLLVGLGWRWRGHIDCGHGRVRADSLVRHFPGGFVIEAGTGVDVADWLFDLASEGVVVLPDVGDGHLLELD